MAMYRYQLNNNPNIGIEQGDPPPWFSLCRDGVYRPQVPAVHSDAIEPTENYADGKIYDSWSQFKKAADDNGCIARKPGEGIEKVTRKHTIDEKAFETGFKDAIDKTFGV